MYNSVENLDTLGCDAMTRQIVLLLIGILVSSAVGCSWIEIENFPKAKTADTDWVKVKFRPPLSGGYYKDFTSGIYKFQHRNVSLIIKNSYYSGHSNYPIFIGPPLLPIFPIFAKYRKEPFQHRFDGFSLDVESLNDMTKIDFSKIRIQVSGGRLLQPNAVRMWPPGDRWNWAKGKEIPIQQVEVSKEKISFHIGFDARESELVEYFALDLGEIVIDDENIKVPVLQYSKGLKWYFILLAIGSEGVIAIK